MNLNAASVEEILWWVQNVRMFMKRVFKSEYEHIQNMLNARVNYNALFECVMFVNCLRKYAVIGFSVNWVRE